MRYRDIITNNIEVLEGQLKTLRRMVQRGESIQEFLNTLDATEERLDKIKSYVQLEPRGSNEVGGN
jgi:DNA-binding FrmR family transcriptional regulator